MVDKVIRIKIDSGNSKQEIRSLDSEMRDLGSTAGKLTTGLNAVTSAIRASISIAGVVQLGQYADAWTHVGNKIRQTTQTIEQFNAVQEAVYRIAQSGRVDIEGVASAFQRIDGAVSAFGFSQRSVINVVEGLTKAFAAGGASAQEVSSVLVQLGQGLGTGALQGEELIAVLEASLPVSKAIAKEFGVNVAQLKALGEQGKLTTERVFGALQNAMPQFQAAFDKSIPTIAQGITVANNSLTQFIGEFDKLTGISGSVSGALISLANSLDSVTDSFRSGLVSAISDAYVRQFGIVKDELAQLIEDVKAFPDQVGESLDFSDNRFVKSASVITNSIGKALDLVSIDLDLTFDATANHGGSVAELLKDSFLNIITNVRAAVRVATVELASMLDAAAARASMGVQALFSDEAAAALDTRLKAIEQAKTSTIDAILTENAADKKATQDAIDLSKQRAEALRKEREARLAGTSPSADPLAAPREVTNTGAVVTGKPAKPAATPQSVDSGGSELANNLDTENQLIDSALALRIESYRLYGATINNMQASEYERQRAQLEMQIAEQQASAELSYQSDIARIETRRQQINENQKLSGEERLEINRLLDEQLILMEQTKEQTLTEINADGKAARDLLAEQERKTRLYQMGQLGSSLMSLGQEQSKGIFKIGQGLSLAQAAIALPTAVMESFKNGGGYPWGLAPAAAMAATGLKNIQAIKNASVGGGSASAFVGSGTSSGGAAPTLPTTPQSAPQVGSFEITGLAALADEIKNLDPDQVLPVGYTQRILASLESVQRLQGA